MTREPSREELESLRVNPNPRIVALLDFAIDEIAPRLSPKDRYADWLAWAARWRNGERRPQDCVDVAHHCFDSGKDDSLTMWHTLGQLAWGAKEACYSAPESGWLVIRYIADAMCAFGVAYPDRGILALESPTIEGEASDMRHISTHL